MKSFVLLFCLTAVAALAQVAPPAAASSDPAPSTVLATIDGRKLTYGELQSYLSSLPPEQQKAALQNRREMLRQYAVMKQLVAMANQGKLDQKSPYKEALESSRLSILTNAQINEQYLKIPVGAEDQKKFYEDHKDRYTEVKLKVLYLSFAANPSASAKDAGGKPFRSEAEAKAKVESILQEIRGGADFETLVGRYSEDDKSKGQKGDFGTLRKSDNLPEDIRAVVFQLKKGEVSGPVRQRNGFYLFRAEDVSTRSYEDVRSDIYTELKNTRMREWLDNLSKSIPVRIEDESFFEKSTGPAASASPGLAPPSTR